MTKVAGDRDTEVRRFERGALGLGAAREALGGRRILAGADGFPSLPKLQFRFLIGLVPRVRGGVV